VIPFHILFRNNTNCCCLLLLSSFFRHLTSHPKEKSGDITGQLPCKANAVETTTSSDSKHVLQEEVARLQENVDKKDSMLSMLTEGLKEVSKAIVFACCELRLLCCLVCVINYTTL
jgi:hypothetical protein